MTTIEKLADVAKKHGVAVGASTLALGAGFLAGYYFAKHRLEESIYAEAEQQIEEQVEAAQRYIKVVRIDAKPATPSEALEDLIPEAADALEQYVDEDTEKILSMYQGKEDPPEGNESATHSKEEPVAYQRARFLRIDEKGGAVTPLDRQNNIWDDAKPEEGVDFEYKEEVAARTDHAPYIVSLDEFNENPDEYVQIKLTYFAGDGILVDEDDDIVKDPNKWVGVQNLRFGHRSGDNRTVYIRNPLLDHDFAVVLSDGHYAVEVAGLDQSEVEKS
jgi:hypothetical protein